MAGPENPLQDDRGHVAGGRGLARVLDFAPTRMGGVLAAFGAKLFMLQFGRGFFIDAGFVVLHFARAATQVHIGVFSAWHKVEI